MKEDIMLIKVMRLIISRCISLQNAYLHAIVMLFFLNLAICISQDTQWQGREVFNKKGCINCHAIAGKGGTRGPDLAKDKFYGTYLELAALMWSHFPRMSDEMMKSNSQLPKFTTSEMSQLVAYLAFMRYKGEDGNSRRGMKFLRSKNCIACHKFGGEGGTIGPDITAGQNYLSPLSLVESMWNHGPNMFDIFKKNNVERPMFADDEIVDLASAIRSYMSPTRVSPESFSLGNSEKGKELVQKKGCTKCHSVHGTGGSLAPDFAKIDMNCSVTQIAGKMWNHAPKMFETMKKQGVSYPIFAKGEMADVIGFLYALHLEDPSGKKAAGKKIIADKGCLNCHKLQEKKTGTAPDLSTVGKTDSPLAMIALMWNHAPTMQQKLKEKQMKWQTFNAHELADLYAYLRDF